MDPIRLRSAHLCIPASVATLVFGDESQAYVAYRPDGSILLLAPASSQWFYKMHQPKQYLLKTRSLRGDKAIALHEVLIDHELDDQDRELNYAIQENTGILKVNL